MKNCLYITDVYRVNLVLGNTESLIAAQALQVGFVFGILKQRYVRVTIYAQPVLGIVYVNEISYKFIVSFATNISAATLQRPKNLMVVQRIVEYGKAFRNGSDLIWLAQLSEMASEYYPSIASEHVFDAFFPSAACRAPRWFFHFGTASGKLWCNPCPFGIPYTHQSYS